MRSLPPHSLFLGHAGDTRDLAALRRAGIVALVDLAVNEPPLMPGREMVYCRFPMVDGAGNGRGVLRAAIETTVSLVRGRVPTLLFCSAGMSRSPAVAAAVLSVVTGTSAGEWLEEIAKGGGNGSRGRKRVIVTSKCNVGERGGGCGSEGLRLALGVGGIEVGGTDFDGTAGTDFDGTLT